VSGQKETDIGIRNSRQQALRTAFDPFFEGLHSGLKQLDKRVRQHEKVKLEAMKAAGKKASTDRDIKQLKEVLEQLHQEVKNAESYYKHIHWLQARFPNAEYEDVTGLCKLATVAEVKEQDYSLNPGRYVGVVIEEDGKTEEEFVEELITLNEEYIALFEESEKLKSVIISNVASITGEGE